MQEVKKLRINLKGSAADQKIKISKKLERLTNLVMPERRIKCFLILYLKLYLKIYQNNLFILQKLIIDVLRFEQENFSDMIVWKKKHGLCADRY